MATLTNIFKAFIKEAYSEFKLTGKKVHDAEFDHEDDDEDVIQHSQEYLAKRNNEKYLDYLNEHYVNAFFIDENGLLSSDGDINFSALKPEQIIIEGRFIVQFGTVKSFSCQKCGLTTLKGCPLKCRTDINCSYNDLTDLKYCPTQLIDEKTDCGFSIQCHHNPNLTTLEGCCVEEADTFNCSHTAIENLDHAPRKIMRLNCSTTKITSLKGSVEECDQCECSNNENLTSILGIKNIKQLIAKFCPKLKLNKKHIPEVSGIMFIGTKMYKNSQDLISKL